jgi:hypothetical protein
MTNLQSTILTITAVAAATLGILAIYEAVTADPGDELLKADAEVAAATAAVKAAPAKSPALRLAEVRLTNAINRRTTLRDRLASQAASCVTV